MYDDVRRRCVLSCRKQCQASLYPNQLAELVSKGAAYRRAILREPDWVDLRLWGRRGCRWRHRAKGQQLELWPWRIILNSKSGRRIWEFWVPQFHFWWFLRHQNEFRGFTVGLRCCSRSYF